MGEEKYGWRNEGEKKGVREGWVRRWGENWEGGENIDGGE